MGECWRWHHDSQSTLAVSEPRPVRATLQNELHVHKAAPQNSYFTMTNLILNISIQSRGREKSTEVMRFVFEKWDISTVKFKAAVWRETSDWLQTSQCGKESHNFQTHMLEMEFRQAVCKCRFSSLYINVPKYIKYMLLIKIVNSFKRMYLWISVKDIKKKYLCAHHKYICNLLNLYVNCFCISFKNEKRWPVYWTIFL